jgi:hypothetical protein
MRRVCKTTVDVQKQQVLHTVNVFVLVIQNAKRMRRIIVSFVASLAPPYFSTLFHKRHDFSEQSCRTEKECFDLIYNFRLKHHFKKNSARYYHKCIRSSRKVQAVLLRF